MGLILHRSDARRKGRTIDIERAANAVQRVHHMGRSIHPAEPQVCKPVNLGERARHHHVVRGRDQLKPRSVVVAPHIFCVGGIQHQQHVGGERRVQALHLVKRQIRACRVVGVGEINNLCARRYGCDHRVHIGCVVLFLDDNRRAASRQNGNFINQKAMLREHAFVASPHEAIGDEREQFIRA